MQNTDDNDPIIVLFFISSFSLCLFSLFPFFFSLFSFSLHLFSFSLFLFSFPLFLSLFDSLSFLFLFSFFLYFCMPSFYFLSLFFFRSLFPFFLFLLFIHLHCRTYTRVDLKSTCPWDIALIDLFYLLVLFLLFLQKKEL